MNTRTEALQSESIAQTLCPGGAIDVFDTSAHNREHAGLPTTAKIVLRMLDGISTGQIHMTLPDGRRPTRPGSGAPQLAHCRPAP